MDGVGDPRCGRQILQWSAQDSVILVLVVRKQLSLILTGARLLSEAIFGSFLPLFEVCALRQSSQMHIFQGLGPRGCSCDRRLQSLLGPLPEFFSLLPSERLRERLIDPRVISETIVCMPT